MQLFPLSLSSTLTNPQPVVVLVVSSGGPRGPGPQVGPPRGVFPAAAAAAVQMCSVCLRTSVQTLPERRALFSSAGVILAEHPFLFSTHNPLILGVPRFSTHPQWRSVLATAGGPEPFVLDSSVRPSWAGAGPVILHIHLEGQGSAATLPT